MKFLRGANISGYVVPDDIVIWLYRLWLLELLNKRCDGNRFYYFGNGFHVLTSEENEEVNK